MPVPYPADWVREGRTHDGASFLMRPLTEEDRSREIGFIAALSDETRYLRTMHPLRVLSPHLLDQLMDVDYEQRMAFVASIIEDDGVERFVGVARYGVEPDRKSAEFAVTTTDEWQGRGVASQLMVFLLQYARSHGVERVFGLVLPENVKMIALAKSLGMSVEHQIDERLIRVSGDLARLPSLETPRSARAPVGKKAAAAKKKVPEKQVARKAQTRAAPRRRRTIARKSR